MWSLSRVEHWAKQRICWPIQSTAATGTIGSCHGLPTMISSTFNFISYFCKFINLSILQFLIYIVSQRKDDWAVIEWEEKKKERTKKRKMTHRSNNTGIQRPLEIKNSWGHLGFNQLHTCAYVCMCMCERLLPASWAIYSLYCWNKRTKSAKASWEVFLTFSSVQSKSLSDSLKPSGLQ